MDFDPSDWGVEDADSDRPQPFFLTPIDSSPLDHDERRVEFPPPSDSAPVNINMMPFLAGATFEDCRLPESVRPYWSLIEVRRSHP